VREHKFYLEGDSHELDFIDDSLMNDIVRDQMQHNYLGLYCGKVDGIWGPRSEKAMSLFQMRYNLEPTGLRDQKTISLLIKIYDRETGTKGDEKKD
jgi:peptidoglycan hydrolase-like protein with peptidoglycan-binding domain